MLDKVPDEILAEVQNIEKTIALCKKAMSRKRKTEIELSAIGACLSA